MKNPARIKTRIRVETLNNGTKRYIPEEKVLSTLGSVIFTICFGIFIGTCSPWVEIHFDYVKQDEFTYSKNPATRYTTLEEAMKVIDNYLAYKKSKHGQHVAKTTYVKHP